MGIRPWRQVQKDFDPDLLGAIMSSYFGGRAEVHIRRTIVPTLYCDFASMYPTVCTLMGLWRFVIAQGIETDEATEQTRAFLAEVTLAEMQKPAVWKTLTTLVQVIPEADIFPVRARYASKVGGATNDMPTIGLNYLSSDQPLWFTLADCVASKLLTGKSPKVLRAIRFTPKPPQQGLRSVSVAGKSDFEVHPATDDFYKRVIELRRRVKQDYKASKALGEYSQDTKNLDMEQLALKILANATSYGIFIELNVEDADHQDPPLSIFTSQGSRTVKVSKREKPGRFFHPLLGTLITGAARLMLALTEPLAKEQGLNWAFCDTDSMAFANLAELPFTKFRDRVAEIRKWFEPLNPYEQDEATGPVSILELEDQNYSKKDLTPLFCFAISAKRYALFNIDKEESPVIRKASAHALGHYAAPYDDGANKRGDRDNGVRVWEEDVWKEIIKAALSDNPNQVDYGYRPEMDQPARSQYSATRPGVLDWFKRFNVERDYPNQVKPFNFMLTYYAHRQGDLMGPESDREWDQSLKEFRPVSPFSKDISKALPRIFDRNSDPAKQVPREWLRTVSDVLRDYHRQPEYKFLGGGWNERGILRRRHIFAEVIEDIGKESTDWEEDDARSEEPDLIISYPSSPLDRDRKIALIKSVPKGKLQRVAKIAMRTIDAVHSDDPSVSEKYLTRMANAAARIKERDAKANFILESAVSWLKQRRAVIGLAALAGELKEDKANLSKVISRNRKCSEKLFAKISISKTSSSADHL